MNRTCIQGPLVDLKGSVDTCHNSGIVPIGHLFFINLTSHLIRRITTFLIYFRNGERSNTRLTEALSVKCTKIIKESRKVTKRRFFKSSEEIKLLECLQSAFFLKIRLVLISSSAIANHDVIITVRDWDQTRKDLLLFFFFFTPLFLAARGFAACVLRFCVQKLCKEK